MSYKDNNTEIVIQSFKKTFETENLVDMLSQAGEVGLDYTLDIVDSAQILKDIPVLGLIVSGTKTIANIRNYFLAKKVFKFLFDIKDIPIEKRRKFANEYCKENCEDTASALLIILDRLNNHNNVSIICRLMRAKINGHISIAEFNRAVLSLERTSYTDIYQLSKFVEDYYEEGLAEAFESAGLVYQSVVGGGNAASDSKSGTKMRLSPTGRILLAYGLNVEVETHAPRTTDVRGSLNWETLDDVEAFTVKK